MLVGLGAALLVGGGFYGLSMSVWGSSGSLSIVRMYQDNQSFPNASGTFRLVTSALPSDPRFQELIVPKDIYDQCEVNDSIAFTSKEFGLVGTEALDFKVTNGGVIQVQWDEGYLYFYASIAFCAIVAGVVAWSGLSIINSMMGLGKLPE
jgi:hypothetical protein